MQPRTWQRALELLAAERGEYVVEIGCGPGYTLVSFGEYVGQEGRVIGLDAAPRMLTRARQRAVREGTSEQIDVLLGDARSLSVRNHTADIVFIEDTLELFSEAEMAGVVHELQRIFREDGRVGVVMMERAGAENDLFVKGYDWLFERMPGYERLGCRPIYARRTLEEGGFDVVRQERLRRVWMWPIEILIARPKQLRIGQESPLFSSTGSD